ncbi:MAG TPA: aminotransferase class III-fold pyridoxal phosphate-dependent enzyme, partial [Gaiella sp.]|nr:aminotransferase class III-fold pyridoxal phosphate-dependent enzyme [Gaiella sp.]
MAATRTIEIRTEIPGPCSRALAEREARAVAHPLRVHLPIFAARAENATITDVDGNVFVDFAGGVGVVNAGHAHPAIVEAVAEQAARFLHTDYTVVPYETFVELAERLCALVPIGGETRAAFFNAGTEAVENAVKLARLHTGRPGVIAFEGAFHGRTLLAMTMTSKFHPYKTGMGPYAPEVHRAAFPNAYRGPSAAEALRRLERMFDAHVPADRIAAIVFEPQLGEGGFVPAPPEFVRGLRDLCDRHGIVLVADEVQTGFGRTGRMFAMEHFDVEPDLVTVAKSIAAG